MITIPEMLKAISKRAEGRYEVSVSNAFDPQSPSLSQTDCATVLLRRANQEGAGWRTVLIVAFPVESEKIRGAFRWAADVRDMLAEPQTADLYMFMLLDGIEAEDAARLETDESFCRKIVVRGDEDTDSLLNRSFLATLSPAGESESISDPLLASLDSLAASHAWVVPHLESWRELLTSGRSGVDIANALKLATFGEEETR